MNLLIYTPVITNRIGYIFKFIFKDILLLSCRFTDDISEFVRYPHPKISYADQPVHDELFFKASSLLLKKNMEQQEAVSLNYQDYTINYPVQDSVFPFDVFAASFYLLSRYEEYLPSALDGHSRFRAEESYAFKHGFLNRPVIDEWAFEIKKVLQSRFPGIDFPKRNYLFLPTIDIDRAYAYRSSGFIKNTLRFGKALLKGDLERAGSIIQVGSGRKKDPYDTYLYMSRVHRKITGKPIFFFLMGDAAKYDVNLHFKTARMHDLIIKVGKYADIGIHPSYWSNYQSHLIEKEKRRLGEIIHTPVKLSRQHYLRLHLPQTYYHLMQAGISDDYSMGYASQIGFRAGTCTSFTWYDLANDQETELRVHPFAVMDVTLNQYLKLSADEALSQVKQLSDHVRNVDGIFTTLWHNESLSDINNWKGWRKVYRDMVMYVSETNEI
jgi:hypothetical protein